MPTSEWNAATSSGIDVIGTRRAIKAPIEPPIATPRTTSTQPMPSAGGWAASVVATAIAMPIMPKKLPCRDDAGLDSPRSERMNSTPATRYKTAARLAFIDEPPLLSSTAKVDDSVIRSRREWTNGHGVLDARFSPGTTTSCSGASRRSSGSLLVHAQHALSDQETAENIHAGKGQRDEAEAARPRPAAADHRDPHREQRADNNDGGDRVGYRHQRGVQGRRHRPHNEVADEHGEHEN